MNYINKLLFLLCISLFIFSSCHKEDESDELDISFKMDTGYTDSDMIFPAGTDIKIGIEAETKKQNDPIIKFNISESVNNGSSTTVYSEDLDTVTFEYDYNFTLSDTVSNNVHTYTFTITNRDGINAQTFLNITVE